MIRITQKELRRVVREVAEGSNEFGSLLDAVMSAVEQLQNAKALCPQTPEFQALAGTISEALDLATIAGEGLSELADGAIA